MAESWPQIIDGIEYWVTRNDDGTYSKTPTGNSGGGGAPNIVPSGGGQVYQTREGPKTVAQMQAELRAAGGNPPSDADAVFQMYQGIPGGGGGGGGAFNWSGLWGGVTGSNQQQFDWDKERYNRSLEEQKREFDRQQYSNLAQGLLSGAASLRGPQDWLKYAQYTTGGKNIFNRLFGDQAASAFGATGYSAPATIQQLLADLGLGGASGQSGTPAAGGTSGLYQTINGPRTVEQMREELIKAGGEWARTGDASHIISDYGKVTGGQVTPMADKTGPSLGGLLPPPASPGANVPMPPPIDPDSSLVRALGQATAPLTGKTQPNLGGLMPPPKTQPSLGGLTPPPSGTAVGLPAPVDPGIDAVTGVYPGQQNWLMGEQPGGAINPGTSQPSQQGTDVMAPLPYQINPAVWDSLSNTAKQLILATAVAGKTPSGAWDAGDYLAQLNASRPVGTAPRRTQMNWGTQSLF